MGLFTLDVIKEAHIHEILISMLTLHMIPNVHLILFCFMANGANYMSKIVMEAPIYGITQKARLVFHIKRNLVRLLFLLVSSHMIREGVRTIKHQRAVRTK